MSSDNFKDLTPDDNYASVELTGDSIVLPPDAEDVILVVEGDSSISGTVNVEIEHSNDNVNFTTAKNKPLTTGAGSGQPAAPTIDAYFNRMPNPRAIQFIKRNRMISGGPSSTSSVFLGELILQAIDSSNPNGTYSIQITGAHAQYVEFRATNENNRTSYQDNFQNEVLDRDPSQTIFVGVQDPTISDGRLEMYNAGVQDFASPQQYLSNTSGASENPYNVNLKLKDSFHGMQQGHTITGINFKNKVELHTRGENHNYASSFSWLLGDVNALNWDQQDTHMGVDRGIDIQLIITPEFGTNPTPVTINNPYIIRGVPNLNVNGLASLPATASIGDSFGNLVVNTVTSPFSLPALTYELQSTNITHINIGSTSVTGGQSIPVTLNQGFSPFTGLTANTTFSVKEPDKGLTSFSDTASSLTLVVQSNPLAVTAGTVTNPSNTAASGEDVCSVSVAGGLGTESITLTLAGTDASYYQLNNITTSTTGSTITATSTDTVVLETNQAFSFTGYNHSVDINASFTDSYGTYTDSVTGISISQTSYTLTSSVSSIDEGNTFTVDLNTVGTTAGDNVAYTITGVDSADINGASLTGNFTLTGTLDDTITFTVTADATTEGSETFTLSLDNGADSVSVTINDTSTTPAAGLSSGYALGAAYAFGDHRVEFSNSSNVLDLSSTASWTISFWMKTHTTGNSYYNIIGQDTSTPNFSLQGYTSTSYNILRVGFGSSSRVYNLTQSVTLINTWTHVTVRHDGTSGGIPKISINNGSDNTGYFGSISHSTNSQTVPYFVGANPQGGTISAPVFSNIDLFAVFDTDLSSSERTALYNSGSGIDPATVNSTNLVRLLNFEDANDLGFDTVNSVSYTVTDSSTYLSHVTLTSSDAPYIP